MKDSFNIDDSVQSEKKSKNLFDQNQFSVSMITVLTKNEKKEIEGLNHIKSVSGALSSRSRTQWKGIKNGSNFFLQKEEVMQGKIASKKQVQPDENSTFKLSFHRIEDISLFKTQVDKKVVYFYRFKGDFSQLKKDNDNINIIYEVKYDEIQIPISFFVKEDKEISTEGGYKELFQKLSEFSQYLTNFIEVGTKFYMTFEKYLKYISFDTYLVFILQEKGETPGNDKDEISKGILDISIEELKGYISGYIDHVLKEISDSILPFEGCETIYDVIKLLKNKIGSIGKYINSVKRFSEYSLLKNIYDIITKINSFLFVSFDLSEKLTSTIGDYLSVADSNESFDSTSKAEKISAFDKKIEKYQSLISSIFYIFLIKINNYIKDNYPLCCGAETTKDINYIKSPYALCLECKMLVCRKCFRSHSTHRYFDIANILNKKIGNISSKKDVFLNYRKNNSGNFKERYAEDQIVKLILKCLEFDIDDFLKKNYTEQSKTVNLTIMNLIDLFLFEYLFKLVFPYLNNEAFFKYELAFQSDKGRKGSIVDILSRNELTEPTLYESYLILKERESASQRNKTIKDICKNSALFGEDYQVDLNLDSQKKVENHFEDESEYYFTEKLDNFDIIKGNQNDFQAVLTNFFEIRRVYNKDKKSKKEGQTQKKVAEINQGPIRDYLNEVFFENGNEKKLEVVDFLQEKLDVLKNFKLDEETKVELRWYCVEKDYRKKRSVIKFIDGFGPVYEFVMFYFEDIISAVADFENYSVQFSDQNMVTIAEESL